MLVLDQLTVRSGTFVLRDLRLDLPLGAYAVLTGRTGAGKTTLLETLAGLRPTAGGRIRFGDRDLTELPPAERELSLVPQDLALFPHLDVFDQIAFGPRARRWPRSRVRDRVRAVATGLEIDHLLGARVTSLSGGERQRVALARALAPEPRLLLLDEPLSALDAATRSRIAEALTDQVQRAGITTIHVTHHPDDVDGHGDHRFEIADGRLRPLRPPTPADGT